VLECLWVHFILQVASILRADQNSRACGSAKKPFLFFEDNRIFLNQKRLHTYIAHTQNRRETTRRRLGISNSVPCSLITHMNCLLSPQKNVSGIRAKCNGKCQTDMCTWSRTTVWEEKTETKWLALRVFERRSCVSQARANIHPNRHLLA
jgi:hypothetical protein